MDQQPTAPKQVTNPVLRVVLVVIVVLVLGAGSLGLYLVLHESGKGYTLLTYQNAKYGYSFQYPSYLNVFEGNETYTFVSKDQNHTYQPTISINLIQNDSSYPPGGPYVTIDEWYNSFNHGYSGPELSHISWLGEQTLKVTGHIASYYGLHNLIEHYVFSVDKSLVFNIRYDALAVRESELFGAYRIVLSSFVPGERATLDTSDWEMYKSEKYKFSLDYPSDWEVVINENSSPSIPVISLTSPETKQNIENNYCEGCGPDLLVYFIPSVTEDPSNIVNRLGAESLVDLINKDQLRTKIGERIVKSMVGTEVYETGFGEYYVLYFEKESQIYRLYFSNKSSADKLSEIENSIINSFRLSN